jgi:hypothetical protein
MTLQEQTRHQRAKQTRKVARQRTHQQALLHNPDYRVMPWSVFLERNLLSKATANRLRKEGRGPRIVHLSPRRIGVRYCDEAAWQQSRSGA